MTRLILRVCPFFLMALLAVLNSASQILPCGDGDEGVSAIAGHNLCNNRSYTIMWLLVEGGSVPAMFPPFSGLIV